MFDWRWDFTWEILPRLLVATGNTLLAAHDRGALLEVQPLDREAREALSPVVEDLLLVATDHVVEHHDPTG